MSSEVFPAYATGFLVASFVLFLVVGDRRSSDPTDSGRGSFALGSITREWFYWLMTPLQRLVVRILPWPTAFNVGGALLGLLSGYLFATGSVIAGGWALLASGVADIFDGRIARARGMDSPRGAFLDSTLDRFAEVGALAGLTAMYIDTWLAPMATLGLGGSLLVSYTRARGESVGVVCKLGVMQRAERILLLGLGAIFDPLITRSLGWEANSVLTAALLATVAGTVGTALFRTVWIASRLPTTSASAEE